MHKHDILTSRSVRTSVYVRHQGRSQEFVSERTKVCVPPPSGSIQGQILCRFWSEAPVTRKKYAENLIERTNVEKELTQCLSVRTILPNAKQFFGTGNFGGGMSPCPSLRPCPSPSGIVSKRLNLHVSSKIFRHPIAPNILVFRD